MRSARLGWMRPRVLAAVAALAAVLGCAGASRAPGNRGFLDLIAVQQSYARGSATPDQWTALARDFAGLVRQNPDSDDADDALFGAGVSYFYAGTPATNAAATKAFRELRDRFPTSPHAPNALYWSARAYGRLGDPALAHRHYQLLVNNYPSSTYAAEAWNAIAPPPPKPVAPARTVVIEDPKPKPKIDVSPPPKGEPTPVVVTPPSQPIVQPPTQTAPKIGASPTLMQQLGLGVSTIVIDPGHGGKDYGATAPGLPSEKEINLDVSTRLAALLEERGLRVLMTRKDDTFIPLAQRNELARKWNADLFVSIHVNSAESPAGNGVETWVCAPARDARSARAAARENAGSVQMHDIDDLLADILVSAKTAESRSLAARVQEELANASGSNDRGIKEAGFVVLAGLRVPSVLVELGFLSNPTEGRRLATPSYRETLAEAIARGIMQYATSFSVTATAK
ncbi:tetratricopeptide repeat protein [Candidatus Poribacteria bacterium]|nr:tetratricopeptide repeat protein [Candidatus Poribacteria bacterium]